MKPNPKNVPSDAWAAGPTDGDGDYPKWFLDWFEDNYPTVDISSPDKKTRALMEREYGKWRRHHNPIRKAIPAANPKASAKVWYHRGEMLVDSPSAAGIMGRLGWKRDSVTDVGGRPVIGRLMRRVKDDPALLAEMRKTPFTAEILDPDVDPWSLFGKRSGKRRGPSMRFDTRLDQ